MLAEVNAPIFRGDKLTAVMHHPAFTGELVGWGTDFVYHHALVSGSRRDCPEIYEHPIR